MKVGNKVLGLAIGQKSIQVAEVVAKGEHFAVTHCAEYLFPDGVAMSQPDKLGHELRQFLRERHFTAKDTVIGLPAKRLVTRRKEVPPATMAIAAGTLRVQAEGEFSAELDNLVMDFAGEPSETETTTVLLIATKKVEVDECEALAQAAGLRVVAVTSTTAALGRATSRLPGGSGLVLCLGPTSAELVIQHGQDPAHLRHLNVTGGAEAMSSLAGEIRRTMAAIPQNGTPLTMALWNSGAMENPQSLLEQRLSMPVTMPDVSNLVVAETPNTEGFAPAIALGLGALDPAGMPIDFLHSRLAPPKAPVVSMQQKLAIAGGVLAVCLAAFGYVDWSGRATKLADLTAQVTKDSYIKDMAAAKKRMEHRTFAIKWLPKSPININVLRDVTTIFAQYFPGPNTIWATSLGNSRDIYTWELDGKATSQEYPTTIADAMAEHPERFLNARVTNIIWEPTPRLWSFRMQFIYIPPEGAAPMIATTATRGVTTTRSGVVRGGMTGGMDPNTGFGAGMGGFGAGGMDGGGMGGFGGGGPGGMGGGMGGMGGGGFGGGGAMGGGGFGGGGMGGGGGRGGRGGGGMGGFGGGGFGGGGPGGGGGFGGAAGGAVDGGAGFDAGGAGDAGEN